jgi:hypothetical protein
MAALVPEIMDTACIMHRINVLSDLSIARGILKPGKHYQPLMESVRWCYTPSSESFRIYQNIASCWNMKHFQQCKHIGIPASICFSGEFLKQHLTVNSQDTYNECRHKNMQKYMRKYSVLINYFNLPHLWSRTVSLRLTNLLTWISTEILHGDKERPACKSYNLTTICESIV